MLLRGWLLGSVEIPTLTIACRFMLAQQIGNQLGAVGFFTTFSLLEIAQEQALLHCESEVYQWQLWENIAKPTRLTAYANLVNGRSAAKILERRSKTLMVQKLK